MPRRSAIARSSSKLRPRAEIATLKHTVVREEILNAAARLFAERGYRAVSMDDVAASLQYTKSVIYYYFENKNEILWQIFSRSFEKYTGGIEAARAADEPTEVTLANMIRAHALSVMGNREYATIYNNEASELTAAQRQQLNRMDRNYDAIFESVYQRGVAEGKFRDIPAHVAVGGILGMCNWLHVWYNEDGPLSAEQIADHFVKLLGVGYSNNDHPPSVGRASGVVQAAQETRR